MCDQCGKTCQNKTKLTEHKRNVHGAEEEIEGVHEWQCDFEGCGFIVRRKKKTQLQWGIDSHKGQRSFNSNVCISILKT